MAVVALRSAVQAYPHPDIEIVKKLQVSGVKADGIRLYPASHDHGRASRFPHREHQVGDQIPAGQQWLATMQDQIDPW